MFTKASVFISGLRLVTAVAVLGGGALLAENVVPSFETAPAGWTTDRYAPASFTNIGTYQGMGNVIAISNSTADSLANRPAGYQNSFYNTQGLGININGGAGDNAAVFLYVPSSWANPALGNVRTDEWLVVKDSLGAVSGYPIIGFTNYGDGGARFRGWDDQAGNWIDFSAPVQYDQWNLLDITYNGGAYDYGLNLYNPGSYSYSVNGQTQYTVTGAPGHDQLKGYILQTYNFGDPSIPGAVVNSYTVDYANTPEPGTWGTMVLSLCGLGLMARKRRRQ